MMQIIIQLPCRSVGHVELLAKVFGLENAQKEINSLLFVVIRKSIAVIARDALEEIVGFRLQPRRNATIRPNSVH